MTVEQAKQVLRDAGYYVDNMWHVNDVKIIDPTISTSDAQEVLNNVMTSAVIMETMWDAIKEQVEHTTL
jgi:hypothetical protein